MFDWLIRHFFSIQPGYKHIHSHPLGLEGKGVESEFLERLKMKRAAGKAVKEKNEILTALYALLRLVKGHKINDVKGKIEEIIELLANGLQHTYDVIYEEMLVFKLDLKESCDLIERHGTELNQSQLHEYLMDISEIKSVLTKEMMKYLGGLNNALQGGTMLESSLNIQLEKYELRGFANPLRPFFERLAERRRAKSAFKLEHRLEKYAQRKKALTLADVKDILRIERQYAVKFEKLIRDMSIFSLILIRAADKAEREIVSATSTKRFDLPQTMESYKLGFLTLFNEEQSAIKSLDRSRMQLINMIEGSKGIERTIERVLLKEKRGMSALAHA